MTKIKRYSKESWLHNKNALTKYLIMISVAWAFIGNSFAQDFYLNEVYVLNSFYDWGTNIHSTDSGYFFTAPAWNDEGTARGTSRIHIDNLGDIQNSYVPTIDSGFHKSSTMRGSFYQTTDGGYIQVGTYRDTVQTDLWLVKYDNILDTIWEIIYNIPGEQWGLVVKECWNGGFIVLGNNFSPDEDGNYWLVKLSSTGSIEWEQQYGTAFSENAGGIQVTSDHGYIISGTTAGLGSTNSDAYIVKTDSLGAIEWDYYDVINNNVDIALNIIELSNGNYMYCGANDDENGLYRPALTCLSDTGGLLWTKMYGKKWADAYLWDLVETSDNQIITSGRYTNDLVGGSDGLILKTSLNGDSIFFRTYNGTNDDSFKTSDIFNVKERANGSIITTGAYSQNGTIDTWVLEVNCQGFWAPPVAGFTVEIADPSLQGFFTSDTEYADSVIWYINGDTIYSGSTDTVDYTFAQDGWYDVTIKATVCGDTSSYTEAVLVGPNAISEHSTNSTVHISPNPSTGVFNIEYSFENSNTKTFVVYNVLGKKVLEEALTNGIGSTSISLDNSAKGMYLYMIYDQNQNIQQGKLVTQ
jgi:hypothetical protein